MREMWGQGRGTEDSEGGRMKRRGEVGPESKVGRRGNSEKKTGQECGGKKKRTKWRETEAMREKCRELVVKTGRCGSRGE